MSTILLQKHHFRYQITRKKIRSLRLQITSPNSFSVSAPILTPDIFIKKFIQKNQKWILKHALLSTTFLPLNSLDHLSILGKVYQITFRQSQNNSIVISSQEPQITVLTTSLSQTHLKLLFQKRLKILAKTLITHQINQFHQQIKFNYNRISVRNQRSRFGSCSSKGNLNFNWQIIFFPPDKFQHIILHELIHLSIKNHSKNYWQTLARYDPDYKSNNRWLKQQGTKYYIIKP